MKCFNHPQADAVASCKYCFKGLCPECAKDSGVGIVCSAACETHAKAIHAMVERNKKVIAWAPRTHSRQAIFLGLIALVFLIYGFSTGNIFILASGVVFLAGAVFSAINGRRLAKLSSSGGS